MDEPLATHYSGGIHDAQSGLDRSYRQSRQGAAAAALRLSGASYPEIAEALAFPDAKAARHAVEAHLAERLGDADREILRAEEAGRLERLLRSVWAKAMNAEHAEHLPAAKIALSVIDRHSRLLGLDAPAELVVHSPTLHEIDAWVARVTTQSSVDFLALEAQVIEDDDDIDTAAAAG